MKDNLVQVIKNLNRSSEYDCMLMFSGGKDSSYLLYYLTQELGLRVLTITLTHNFLAKETLENIESFARKYSKKHVTVENPYLNQAGKHFLETWINSPDDGSLITFCTGCRLGLVKLIVETAKRENVNVVISGLTTYEATDYRLKLVNYPRNREGKLFFFLGYLRLILRNPSLIKNFKVLNIQAREFYYYSHQKKIYKQNNLDLVLPFYHYLNYDEAIVIETLKKLNWQKASISSNSFWRADCNMNAVRQFFYNHISGYNEMESYYGKMLKDQIIDKEYYDKNIQNKFNQDDILNVLKASGISDKAFAKYREYLKAGATVES